MHFIFLSTWFTCNNILWFTWKHLSFWNWISGVSKLMFLLKSSTMILTPVTFFFPSKSEFSLDHHGYQTSKTTCSLARSYVIFTLDQFHAWIDSFLWIYLKVKSQHSKHESHLFYYNFRNYLNSDNLTHDCSDVLIKKHIHE